MISVLDCQPIAQGSDPHKSRTFFSKFMLHLHPSQFSYSKLTVGLGLMVDSCKIRRRERRGHLPSYANVRQMEVVKDCILITWPQDKFKW